MAFEKLFWSMTWEIISTSTKKREVGCIPSTCKLRNAWWSRRFIWFHQEPAWTGTFLSTQNALWMCEAWVPVCVLWCNISSINQMNTRCNRSFTEPFQTQLPLRWHWIYPAILFLPISNGSLHISEFFPLHTHKKKKHFAFFSLWTKKFCS